MITITPLADAILSWDETLALNNKIIAILSHFLYLLPCSTSAPSLLKVLYQKRTREVTICYPLLHRPKLSFLSHSPVAFSSGIG